MKIYYDIFLSTLLLLLPFLSTRGEGKTGGGEGRGEGEEKNYDLVPNRAGSVLPELANAYSSLVSVRPCGTEDCTWLVAVFIDQGSSKLKLGSYN